MRLTVNEMDTIKRDLAYMELMGDVLDCYGEDIIREHIVVEEDEDYAYVKESVYEPLWDKINDRIYNYGMSIGQFFGELDISIDYDEIVVQFRVEGYEWSEMRTELEEI